MNSWLNAWTHFFEDGLLGVIVADNADCMSVTEVISHAIDSYIFGPAVPPLPVMDRGADLRNGELCALLDVIVTQVPLCG